MEKEREFDAKQVVIDAFEEMKEKYGEKALDHVIEIFDIIEPRFIKWWCGGPGLLKHSKKGLTGQDLRDEINRGVGQAWRKWKGEKYQELVEHVIRKYIEDFGLATTTDDELENPSNISLEKVRKNVLVRYSKEIDVLPDMDIVIYDPKSLNVLAILSCKVSLRERIAQTAYWKLKLQVYNSTKHIKTYLASPDSDSVFKRANVNKQRIIAEHDTDGAFIMGDVIESDKVKHFNKFSEALAVLKENAKKHFTT